MWNTNLSLLQEKHLSGELPPYCVYRAGDVIFCETVFIPLLLISIWSFYPCYGGEFIEFPDLFWSKMIHMKL